MSLVLSAASVMQSALPTVQFVETQVATHQLWPVLTIIHGMQQFAAPVGIRKTFQEVGKLARPLVCAPMHFIQATLSTAWMNT